MGLDQDIIVRPSDMTLDEYFETKFEQMNNPEHWVNCRLYLRKANQIHNWVFQHKNADMSNYNAEELELEFFDLLNLEKLCDEVLTFMCRDAKLISESNPNEYYYCERDTSKPRAEQFQWYLCHKEGETWSETPVDCPNYDFKFDDDTARWLQKKLPTCMGFFYGSYGYDLSYFEDIYSCYVGIEQCIGLAREHVGWKISYWSSW